MIRYVEELMSRGLFGALLPSIFKNAGRGGQFYELQFVIIIAAFFIRVKLTGVDEQALLYNAWMSAHAPNVVVGA